MKAAPDDSPSDLMDAVMDDIDAAVSRYPSLNEDYLERVRFLSKQEQLEWHEKNK